MNTFIGREEKKGAFEERIRCTKCPNRSFEIPIIQKRQQCGAQIEIKNRRTK